MTKFETPQDAEQLFYEAFETSDIEKMMRVWAEADEITCIHPMGKCLRGREEVQESWQQIFSEQIKVKFHFNDVSYAVLGDTAVHTLSEQITILGSDEKAAPLIATNVYKKIKGSWKMILHHSSVSPVDHLINSFEDNIIFH